MKRFYTDNLNLKITMAAYFGFCKTSKMGGRFYFEVL
jgi:hypothetical protein